MIESNIWYPLWLLWLCFDPSGGTQATEKLALVHSDICGPIQTKSLKGFKYFFLFISDKSHYTMIFFKTEKWSIWEI
jgi:hypothetical protein